MAYEMTKGILVRSAPNTFCAPFEEFSSTGRVSCLVVDSLRTNRASENELPRDFGIRSSIVRKRV